MKIIVAPSILSADLCYLERDCNWLLSYGGADWLHVDVMDGHFVPNLTFGPPVIKSLRKHFPYAFLDCHLMMENPEIWVERIWKSGASSITFHLESTTDPISLIKRIREFEDEEGIKAKLNVGVAIKPSTPVSSLSEELLEEVDMVLVMTVEPGFGGQQLMMDCVEKVRELRFERKFHNLIQVDGGITESNVGDLLKAGANVIVAGSSVFSSTDVKSTIRNLAGIKQC